MKSALVALSLLALLSTASLAQKIQTAHIGEPAPAIYVGEWIKGAPVDLGSKDLNKTVVIEFWASWLPPSLLSFSDRDRLVAEVGAEKLAFVRISDESSGRLHALLDAHEIKIGVARDDRGRTAEAWLDPLSLRSLPHLFIVDQEGRLAWMGKPGVEFEGALASIIDGDWDLAKAREQLEVQPRLVRELGAGLQLALKKESIEDILRISNELAQLQLAAGDRVARSSQLNSVAWALLTREAFRGKHVGEARELARVAVADTNGTRPGVLDTFALALAEDGEVQQAIDVQCGALDLLTERGSADVPSYLETLVQYEAMLPGGSLRKSEHYKAVPPASAKAAPAAVLSANAAREDLMLVRRKLWESYAGMEDLEWKLQGQGSSWDKREADFLGQIEARGTWPVADFIELVDRYLEPVQDSHFWIGAPDDRRYCVEGYEVFFSDLRLTREGAKYVVTAATSDLEMWIGASVKDVDIAQPDTVTIGPAYLFPTLPDDQGRAQWLLGRFAADNGYVASAQTPDPMGVQVERGEGEAQRIELALHRGRSPFQGEWKAWELLETSQAELATLCVRTMRNHELGEGLTETAEALRKEPAVILDLRSNGGGADDAARAWCRLFSAQTYRVAAWANLNTTAASPSERWSSGRVSKTAWTKDDNAKPYAGQLFVLIDHAVASSGETFVRFVTQIPGVTLLGENTAGCVSYGNASTIETLPNSGLQLRYGHTKFVGDPRRPVREGVGYFPDFWLDGIAPQAATARLLGR